MKFQRDLTDGEWARISPLLPELKPRDERRGRPRRDPRRVLDGVLWYLYSDLLSWSKMPKKYPSYQTCHRHFQNWRSEGTWDQISKALFGSASAAVNVLIRSRARDGADERARIKDLISSARGPGKKLPPPVPLGNATRPLPSAAHRLLPVLKQARAGRGRRSAHV